MCELRPGTIIKDEAVPLLLRQQKSATFITTNVTDFWRRAPADDRYCILCFPLPNERQADIPRMLGRILRHPEFGTRAARMGKVAQVSDARIEWYETEDPTVRSSGWLWMDTGE